MILDQLAVLSIPPCPRPLSSPKAVIALEHARLKGLRYLNDAVRSDGAWPSVCTDSSGQTSEEFPPFTAAQGSLALKSCDLLEAVELRSRTRGYLQQLCEYPGIWRYWKTLPPDLDDTAVCSIVLRSHPWIILGLNVQRILGFRDKRSLFRTWMASTSNFEAGQNTIDPVVNANVIAYLGDHKLTQPAQRWIERLVRDGQEADALVFYHEPMDLYLALARATCWAPPVFRTLETVLVERILTQLDTIHVSKHVMRIAQGVVALDMLGATVETSVVNRLITQILDNQSSQGEWAGLDIWHLSPEAPGSFQSEALATASCVDAIERLLTWTR